MIRKKMKPLPFLLLVFTIYMFLNAPSFCSESNKYLWWKELPRKEQKLANMLNQQRIKNGLVPLRINFEISKLIKEEMKEAFNSLKASRNLKFLEKGLAECASNFPEKTFVVKGITIRDIYKRLIEFEESKKEILNPKNLSLCLGMISPRHKPHYCTLHLSKYYITYGLSKAMMSIKPCSKSSTIPDLLTIQGTTNCQELRFKLYSGTCFPPSEEQKMFSKDISTQSDGSFEIELPIGGYGLHSRIAIYGRRALNENFSLIGFKFHDYEPRRISTTKKVIFFK